MQSTSANNVIPIKTLSNLQALILIFKSRFAMGLVFLPYQFSRIGLLPTTILSLCIGLYTLYTLQILVKVKQEISEKLGYKFMSYSYIINTLPESKSLLRIIWISYEILLAIQNMMLCCFFTFLIAVIASIFTNDSEMNHRIFVLVLILPAMIFYQIRTYRVLSYTVAVAILLSVIAICILSSNTIMGKDSGMKPIYMQRLLLQDYKEIPIFMATFVLTISPISIMEAIETYMQQPKALQGWNGILSLTIGINWFLLVLVGLLGSIAFHDAILFNVLEHYLIEYISTRIILILFFISIFITTAIHFNVVFGIVWLHFFEGVFSLNNEIESEVAVRAILTLIAHIVAICLNHQEALLPIVGAFCAIPLTLVYPYVLEFMIIWPERTHHSKWRLTRVFVCTGFGVGLSVIAIFFTVLHCYDAFTRKK